MVQTAEQYEFVHRALCLFEETLGLNSTKEKEEKSKWLLQPFSAAIHLNFTDKAAKKNTAV